MDNSKLLAKLLQRHSAIKPMIEHMQAHCCEANIQPTGSNRQNWAHETVVQAGLNLGSGKSGKREELAAKWFVILHTEFHQGLRHFNTNVIEINALAPFNVSILPIKTGRKVTHIRIGWSYA